MSISRTVTKNLNKIIDVNFYPVKEAKVSNRRHRPIGIGVQGLADVFAKMGIPFNSDKAKEMNKKIFETIYYGALWESMEISKKRTPLMKEYKELITARNWKLWQLEDAIAAQHKKTTEGKDFARLKELHKILKPIPEELMNDKYPGTYSSYVGSPMEKGQCQFDLWEVFDNNTLTCDWDKLKAEIKQWGIRNSLLLAPMPTASTSQILGNNECIEPYTSNIYLRRTIAGEFTVINQHLIKMLIEKGIWNEELKNKIISNDGSVQNIEEIPSQIQETFKTVWEISQKDLIDMAVDRAPFVCQSQSLNLFMSEPSYDSLTSMHFYSWKSGLKTGIYYLRNQPKAKTQKFTVEPAECVSCMG